MDCVFVKARKISKALKGNRGSVVNYEKYLTRELKGIDYTEKGNILASGIVGTEEKPLDFFRKVEERENQTKRKDTARFAKEYIMALPHQLPIDEQTKICKEVAKQLAENGRVVRWVQHCPDTEGDERNFHCHFLLSERSYENGVFAETKNRDWNTKQTLTRHKKEIAEIINLSLEKNHLPKIKVEIEEGRETVPDKTEKEIKAERALKKKMSKADKKLKLAEVKLNGLGRNEIGLADAVTGDSKQPNANADVFREYEQHRADERARELERIRIQNARRLEQEQRQKAERKRSPNKRSDRDGGNWGY